MSNRNSFSPDTVGSETSRLDKNQSILHYKLVTTNNSPDIQLGVFYWYTLIPNSLKIHTHDCFMYKYGFINELLYKNSTQHSMGSQKKALAHHELLGDTCIGVSNNNYNSLINKVKKKSSHQHSKIATDEIFKKQRYYYKTLHRS